ncbi:MAG: formimidoylglutamate deiminase [Gammaproteobacteria bacterium]|nr:formimidoylglutamate deiminase [Gammaproteobacteria bacterium]
MKKIYATDILLANGWARNKTLTIKNGVISNIEDGLQNGAETMFGAVIPAMVNCHSHAFQRAFAGFSEHSSGTNDSFWTWRNTMYSFLKQLTCDDAEVIATQLYIEMLKMGYSRVAEFHYLHHDIDGEFHETPSQMATSIFSAAQNTGIGLTILPVLYSYSGFGAQTPNAGQARFIHNVEQFNQLVTDCFDLSKKVKNSNVGIAPHSLRAVDKQGLKQAVAHVRALDNNAPIHIHIAEQQKEVEDCLAHYGQRPVEWLLDNIDVDQHWCLVHATHINEQERQGISKANAVAGICPTTEANLGDGIFPTQEFLAEGGVLAIGSDSHISVNPIEELRLLEYAQRLIKQQRAVLSNKQTPSTGLNLWQQAAKGGAQATSSNLGELAVGKQADLLVLNPEVTRLFANAQEYLLDSVIFASQTTPIKDVMVNGQWQVINGTHTLEQKAAADFVDLLKRLS